MKNIFEFLGFIFTAIISGFFIFTMIGRTDRKSSGMEREAMVSQKKINVDEAMTVPRSARSERELPELPKISKKNAKSAPAPAPEVNESGIETADLQDLYNDRAFVNNTIKKWKNTVTDAAEQNSLKPEALLAYVVVQCYVNDYTKTQLYKDAARHAGDVVMSADAAAKRYDKGWSVQQLMRRYNMAQYFPEAEEAPQAAYAGVGSAAKGVAAAKKAAPALTVKANTVTTAGAQRGAGRAVNFKDMVAKEYGAKDWNALQGKADAATKAKAEKRVKMLATASMIR